LVARPVEVLDKMRGIGLRVSPSKEF